MAKANVLVTGGAGFIGSHLSKALIAHGYQVRILDNLHPQIHGDNAAIPGFVNDNNIEFQKGDIRHEKDVLKAIEDIDVVVHLAAETGVGQSMYEISRYCDVNIQGTATLLDTLANSKHSVKKVVLASSRAVYGEGKYRCPNCGVVYGTSRTMEQLSQGKWEVQCPHCSAAMNPLPTDENARLKPVSTYGITKMTQEALVTASCLACGIPTVILRYQNVYGPGQSLSNPYTGILSIFSSRLISGKPILLYEDGEPTRDFVYIDDVVSVTLSALEKEEANNEIFNVGAGERTTIAQVAEYLTELLNPGLPPQITGRYRVGDIRHCFADITKIRNMLGWEPRHSLKDGISVLVDWARSHSGTAETSDEAQKELEKHDLFK